MRNLLAESEGVRRDTGVQEFDLEDPIADGALLPGTNVSLTAYPGL